MLRWAFLPYGPYELPMVLRFDMYITVKFMIVGEKLIYLLFTEGNILMIEILLLSISLLSLLLQYYE